MKVPVMVALDTKTLKIWNKLPDQKKSATVRKLLLTLDKNNEQKTPKDQILKSLCAPSSDVPAMQKLKKGSDVNLSEMAAVITSGKRSSLKRPEDNIERQFTKV